MPQIKVGVQLASLKLPFKKALLAAARMGATGVEIDARGELHPQELSRTGARQIRKLLDDLSLRVCAVSFHTRRGYETSEDLERRIDATRRAMEMAQQLGSPVLINSVGHIPQDTSAPEWTLLLESLTDIGRFGQHVGVFLTATTGAEGPAELKRLLDALPAGSLGINLNPGNLVMHGHRPLDGVRQLGEHVLHVHAKDGVRDSGPQRGVEVPLGRGSVDFPELLGALEEQGYRGYFTVEREHAGDPEFELSQAVQYLRNL